MFCTNCGSKVGEGDAFCSACGAKVGSDVSDPGADHTSTGGQFSQTGQDGNSYWQSASQRGASPVPPGVKAVQGAPGTQTKPTSSVAVPVVVLAVVVVIVVVAVLAFVFAPRSDGGGASSASSQAPAASESAASASQSSASSSAAASSSADTSSASSSAAAFDQSKAESEARDAATDAGMQVLSGTVRITTIGERARETLPSGANDFGSSSNDELVLLVFDAPQNLSARSAGDMGRVQTRSGQDCIRITDSAAWRAYDGTQVTAAAYAEDLTFPSDIAGALYSASGRATRIAPLDESSADSVITSLKTSTPQSTSTGGSSVSNTSNTSRSSSDYLLPDSSSRVYARSELTGMTDYELFIARNEIYARHGRIFQSDELKRYFANKSWYKGTVSPDKFDEGVLSTVERKNVNLMLEIEKARGSRYV